MRLPVPMSIWISCGKLATLGQYCVCQIVTALASKLFTAAPFSHCVSWLSTYASFQLVFGTRFELFKGTGADVGRAVEEGTGAGVGVGVGVGAGVGAVVGCTLAADEPEVEDCNTFRSAIDV